MECRVRLELLLGAQSQRRPAVTSRWRGEVHFVLRLPSKRGVRESRVVLLYVERHELFDRTNRIQRVEEQPLVLEYAPPGFDQRIREGDLGLGRDSAQQA